MLSNEVLDRAPASVQALLQSQLRTVSLEAGQSVQSSDGPFDTVYFPTTALLSGFITTSGGHRVGTRLIGKYEAVGLVAALTGQPVPGDVVVQIAGGALSLSARTIRSLALGHPELLSQVLNLAAVETSIADVKIACSLTHNAEQRLCCWFLEALDRMPDQRLEVTQQALATAVGVQRTTVNAVAMELKQARVVRYSRGGIEVLDRQALRARSCDCYDRFEQPVPSSGDPAVAA